MFTRKIFLVVVTQMRNNKLSTVIEYTDKANERLRRKYYRMTLKNGKKSNVDFLDKSDRNYNSQHDQ